MILPIPVPGKETPLGALHPIKKLVHSIFHSNTFTFEPFIKYIRDNKQDIFRNIFVSKKTLQSHIVYIISSFTCVFLRGPEVRVVFCLAAQLSLDQCQRRVVVLVTKV